MSAEDGSEAFVEICLDMLVLSWLRSNWKRVISQPERIPIINAAIGTDEMLPSM